MAYAINQTGHWIFKRSVQFGRHHEREWHTMMGFSGSFVSPEQYMEGEYDSCIRFKSLLENANDLVMVIQDDSIQFVNRKPLADLGYSIQDVNDKSIFDFIHVDDREKASVFQVRKALSEGLPDDLIFRIVCKNGALAFLKIFSIRTEWEGGPARLVCAINITDRKLNEITLRQSESFLYAALNNFPDPTFVIDINGRMYLWNKAMETISGVNSSDIAGKHDFESAVPYSGYQTSLLVDLMLKPDAGKEDEFDYIRKSENTLVAGRFLKATGNSGIRIWVSSSVLYDIQGNVIGAMESFRDVTGIVEVEETLRTSIREKEILLKEIHHRVKNNMQLINSMLRIQLQYVRDPEAADLFRDSINRIETMALIHNDLYKYATQSDINFGEFIPKLVDNLRSACNRPAAIILIEAEGIHLGIDDAIPCALILNELISNGLKYAFPEGSGGAILVKMFFDTDTRLCNLIVHDEGKGLPEDFDFDRNTTTFGLLMVKLLSSQLGGSVCLNSTGGTEFTITFPIKINQEHSC